MSTDLRKAAQQALDAMEYSGLDVGKFNRINEACQSLRDALADPKAQANEQYSAGWDKGWDKGWDQGWNLAASVERELCARIVERNAQACANSRTLSDILNANALLIRARGNNEQ